MLASLTLIVSVFDMKKSVYSVYVLGLLIAGFLLLWILQLQQIHDYREQLFHSKQVSGEIRHDFETTKAQWMQSASSGWVRIPGLDSLISGPNPKLIVRITDHQCSTCVDQLLFSVKSAIDSIGLENVAILYSSSTQASLGLQYRRNILEQVVFVNLVNDAPLSEWDHLGLPYFILCDQDLLFSPYIPIENNDQYCKNYLTNLARKLNEHN